MLKDNIPVVLAANRQAWRKWLQKNHNRQTNVWLVIYHRQSAAKSVYYNEAVEEALCFGWIDSKPNKRDSESYYQFFSRRKPNSKWSKANRERAARMIESGLMTPAGQALIDYAQQNGLWTALDEVQKNILPADLAAALQQNKAADKNFGAFPPSSKRIILEWIQNAKKPETRLKRITETVTLAAKNIKANHYRQ